MTHPAHPLELSEIDAINADASTLTKRGIRLVEAGTSSDIAEALACFDRAIELRSSLPVETVPMLRYGLAACWLNRADALMRLGGTEPMALAVAAYDAALALLGNLPLGDDPRYPRRLAIAHQNRGLALIARGGSAAREAMASFADAIAVLDQDQATRIADRSYLLGAVWMNLANALASEATAESDSRAHAAALRALSLVRDLEGQDADAADVGLKARHVMCRVLARRLSLPTEDGEAITADVHHATDLVDEGLDLIQQWERRDVARFRDIASDLFRFGVRVYGTYQPQFVNDFVREHLDPARSSRAYVESAEIAMAVQDARLPTSEFFR